MMKCDDYTKNSLKKIKKMFKSKEMFCAAYAYDYQKNHKQHSLNRFNNLWKILENKGKIKVIMYFYSFNNYEMMNLKNEDANLIVNEISETFEKFENKNENKILKKRKER